MEIAPVRQTDIQEIIRIQTECELSPWTQQGYDLEMQRPDSIMIAARDRDEGVIGFIVGRTFDSDDHASSAEAEIYNIGTRIVFRNHGVGSMLLDRFLEICRDRHVTKVWLEVRAGNATAIRFYESRGFEVMATRPNFYSAPAEDAQVMALRLDRPSKP